MLENPDSYSYSWWIGYISGMQPSVEECGPFQPVASRTELQGKYPPHIPPGLSASQHLSLIRSGRQGSPWTQCLNVSFRGTGREEDEV